MSNFNPDPFAMNDDDDLLSDSANPVSDPFAMNDDDDLLGDSTLATEGHPVSDPFAMNDDDDLLSDTTPAFDPFAMDVDDDLLSDTNPAFDPFSMDAGDDLLDSAKPALLMSKEEFLEVATRKAGDITEDEIVGQYGKDEINALYQSLLVNPKYFMSLRAFYEKSKEFENKILDRVISVTAPKESLPNPIGKLSSKDAANLFIDGENWVSNLIEAFRRKLQANALAGSDYSVDEFLNSRPSDLGLPLRCDVLKDIINSPRDVATVRGILERMKKDHFYATLSAAENKSYSQDSLITLMKETFSEYKESFELCGKLKEYVKRESFIFDNLDSFSDDDKKLLAESIDIDEANFSRMAYQRKTDEEIGETGLDLYANPEHPVVFTYPASYSALGDTFVCGNCNKESEMKVPFLASIYFDSDSTLLPGVNVCPHCGYVNFAPEDAYRSLVSMKTDAKELKDYFNSKIRKASSNFIKHIGPDQSGVDGSLDSAKPAPFEEVNVSSGDIWNAVERYKAKVKRHIRFKADTKTENAEANVSKFLARYCDTDSDIRNRAISTVIYHLSDPSGFAYGDYLRYSNYIEYQSVIDSESLIHHISECSDIMFQRRMEHMYGVLGIPYMDGYEFTKSDITLLNQKFIEYKQEFETFKQLRTHYIRDIERNLGDLANLEIMQVSVTEDDYYDFMCCEDVRNLIYKWADRMVIYSTLESFVNLRLATKHGYKNFVGRAFFAQDFVTSVQKSLFKEFGLQDSARPVLSIYPSADLNNVFTKILEVKHEYAKDRYSFFVRLNQFIRVMRDSDSIKYDKVLKRIFDGRLLPDLFRGDLFPRLEALINTYGEDGKAVYYLRGQFTAEEIKQTVKAYQDIPYSRYMSKRRGSETLADYIKRITDKDYNPRKDELYELDLDDALTSRIKHSYVGLDALTITAYAVYSYQRIKEHNVYFAGKMVFDTLLKYYTEEQIFKLLKYSSETVNGLIDTFTDSGLFGEDYEEYKSVLRFSSLIFSDPIVAVEMVGTYKQRRAALFNLAAFTGDLTSNQMLNDFADQLDQDFLRARAVDNEEVYVQQTEYIKPSVQKELFDFLNIQG